MKRWAVAAVLVLLGGIARAEPKYPDRFVWIFGWNLGKDSDVAQIEKLLETAAQHGINGAVMSMSLAGQGADYLRRIDQIRQTCDRLRIELIPAGFPIGYGGSVLSANRNLAEGLPVNDAPFLVSGTEAKFIPDESIHIPNGGFEEYRGNQFRSIGFHDQPGQISFVDQEVRHSGNASIRLENFAANAHGHGRVMVKVNVKPHRVYRVSLYVKTQDLRPASAFRVMALARGDRELAPRQFNVPATTDWRRLTMLVNSMDESSLNLYAGMWGGKSGRLWLDDWKIEEVGPVNVLHRPGTPVRVKSEDGMTTYEEGKDYAPLEDRNFSLWNSDHQPPSLKLLPQGRIKNGQKLLVSWYHPMLINDSQVTVCMAEPEVYAIFDREAQALAEHLHPKRVLLNLDEIRMGGTCQACQGRNMGELLGECITKTAAAIHKYSPDCQVYCWSDMLDPNHNAHGNYYLVKGDFTGSWDHIPRDLIIAVWGGGPMPKSMAFFSQRHFATLIACYYDADNLDDVQAWLKLASQTPGVRGLMYTPWERKYQLLPAFGDLLK